jgi:hypothetical protein
MDKTIKELNEITDEYLALVEWGLLDTEQKRREISQITLTKLIRVIKGEQNGQKTETNCKTKTRVARAKRTGSAY